MKVKTGFVFDAAGITPIDEEIQAATDELSDLGLKIVLKKSSETMIDMIKEPFDLLVIDYGGIGSFGSSSQLDGALRWAENHPGSLLILWSKFTSDIYYDELHDQYGHLSNIVLRFEEKDSAYDFIGREKNKRFNTAVRQWFGLEVEVAI